MVESGSPSPSLIEQAAKNRQAEEARRASEEEARRLTPDFKANIGAFISEHVQREVVEITLDNLDMLFNRTLRTILTASVPTEDKPVSVRFTASNYPDPSIAQFIDYEISVNNLDSTLVIEGNHPVIQSKQRQGESITMHTPIGVPLPSWPAWSRSATPQDIQQYESLLTALEQDGVIFEGTAPWIPDTTGFEPNLPEEH